MAPTRPSHPRTIRFAQRARQRLLGAAACALGIAVAVPMAAAGPADRFPERPMRLIVPFPPGAANDTLGRGVGQRLSEDWGQPVIVDNRGGAGGVLGTALAAKAAPDGYTLVLVPATHAINVSLYKKPLYDAVRDFTPVVRIATGAYMLVVHPSVPAKSVKELVAHAKANPGKLSFGSAGTGNATHLIGELLKMMAGIQMTHVPYKGTSPALTDTMAGNVQLTFGTVSAAYPHARSGRLNALAVTSSRRSSGAPDVPTLDESGVTGFEAVGWWGLLAPAGTPAAIVGKINGAVGDILARPDMRAWLQKQGFEPGGDTPGYFRKFIDEEIVKWGKLVAASGATLD